MSFLRKFGSVVAVSLAATSATAGGLSPAAVEPVQVAPAPAPRSSWGMILPIALLVGLVALAVSNDDDDTAQPTDPNDA